MSEADPYLLGYRQTEQERLERQADELAADSERLFDEIGVGQSWRVVEIGCGPRGALGLLSKRVGATGKVVGIERSAEQVGRARRYAADTVSRTSKWSKQMDGRPRFATARLTSRRRAWS